MIICYYMLAFLKPYLGLEESILDLIPTYRVAKHFNTCAASCRTAEGNNPFLNHDIYVLIGAIVRKKNGVDVSIRASFVIRGPVVIKLNHQD